MEFTKEELKMICRALSFYAEHPEYMSEHRYFGTEVQDAEQLVSKIYKENFRI